MLRLLFYTALLFSSLCVSSSADDVQRSEFVRALLTHPLAPQNNHSCPSAGRKLNDFHFRGTALGGWMVLEPWITPSLFYQFLGCSSKWGSDAIHHVAIDSMTFCSALGKEEANRQLRQHWKTWVTEEEIASLASMGLKHIRLPVGKRFVLQYFFCRS